MEKEGGKARDEGGGGCRTSGSWFHLKPRCPLPAIELRKEGNRTGG